MGAAKERWIKDQEEKELCDRKSWSLLTIKNITMDWKPVSPSLPNRFLASTHPRMFYLLQVIKRAMSQSNLRKKDGNVDNDDYGSRISVACLLVFLYFLL